MSNFIKKISIKNYYIFDDCSFEFAIPTSSDDIGLNIVVGKNGTGKSTLLKAIEDIVSNRRLPGEPHTINLVTSNDQELNINNDELVPTNRTSATQVNLRQNLLSLKPNKSINQEHVKKIFEDENLRDYFISLLRNDNSDYVTEIVRTVVQSTPSRPRAVDLIWFKSSNGGTFPPQSLSDGEITLLSFLKDDLLTKAGYIILIEEPETCIHPQAQIEFMKLIIKISEKNQVIITTHSPYFIDWESMARGAKIFKLQKSQKDQKGEIQDKVLFNKILSISKRNRHPFNYDLSSKITFFADKVLILEGQEDVGIIRNYWAGGFGDEIVNYNFDFFGYGSDGDSNMPMVLEMCAKLNMSKVAVIFDKKDNNANRRACENIVSKYGKDYLVIELKAKDIRDKFYPEKDGTMKLRVEGAFETNEKNEVIKLKNNDLGVDLKNNLKKIIKYFK